MLADGVVDGVVVVVVGWILRAKEKVGCYGCGVKLRLWKKEYQVRIVAVGGQ